MLRLSLGLIAILAATSALAKPPLPKSQSGDPTLTKAAVKNCVDQVHDAGYDNFDAYYNEATRNVENNLPQSFVTPDDEATNYEFRKCMADAGFPLGYRRNSN